MNQQKYKSSQYFRIPGFNSMDQFTCGFLQCSLLPPLSLEIFRISIVTIAFAYNIFYFINESIIFVIVYLNT